MIAARFFLFGAPTVEYDGKSVALPFERRNQLLVFLALKRSWVGRAELATLLWPEQESKLAYTNLRKTLFRLQSLPWAHAIESHGGALRFEVQTDVHAFESALREQRIGEAVALHGGELLAGFNDDASEAWSSWLGFERDRLRAAWRDAAIGHLNSDIDAAEATALSKRLLEADPLDEAALRAHMSWLAQDGQGARARQVYRDFVARLKDDLGLAPGSELRALHDSINKDAGHTAAPAISVQPVDSDFVGRTVELRRVGALLEQDDCRLICLIGSGGVGKTRLARRALNEFGSRFADDAAFVGLEDITGANELAARLARALDMRLAGSTEPLQQIITFLRERQMLLVLDNFEQLVAHASILSSLLQGCPKLKMIVTSRIRLALANEWLLPLEGLPCPEIEDIDHFEAFDAVRLFLRSAQRVEPGLVASVEAASIIEICRQLDGLPLALELAAAWTRLLPCEAIAAELSAGTALLRAVDSARAPRHSSIESVFDQSWKLLTDVERDGLARLSVFYGGFSAEAARTIAKTPFAVLGALADKSLLRKDGTRNSLHPLVDQLAGERLSEADRSAVEASHAIHFLRWMAQLPTATKSGDREVLRQLDLDFDNVRAAWQWAVANRRADLLLGSAQTLWSFCVHRGRIKEGLALFREAIDSIPDAVLQPRLSSLAAHFEYQLNLYADAEATATRAIAASRLTGDEETELQAVKTLGGVCLMLGRYVEARRHYKRALKGTNAVTNPNSAAAMLDNLALVEIELGNYDEALRMARQSLIQHQRLADVGGEALCLNNIGSLHLSKGEYELAALHLNQGLAVCERHGLVGTQGVILANLTELAVKTSDPATARAQAERAMEVAVRAGHRSNQSFLKLQLARIALKEADLAAARANLQASLELAIAVGRPSQLLEGVCCFADILEAAGEKDTARRLLEFAVTHPSTATQTRNEVKKRLTQRSAQTSNARKRSAFAFELHDLAHRIVVETPLAHAPLISALRGTGVPQKEPSSA